MGKISGYPSVKLITGFIFKDAQILDKAKAALQKNFGSIDFQSQSLVFNHTDYYQKELGRDLKRVFVSFKKNILPQKLAEIKIATNIIEEKFLAGSGRTRLINIDPGYLNLSKLVLASTKDYIHRIYLGKGIYAEVTLFYQSHSYRPWAWTYPDYKTAEYIEIFNQIRQDYARQIKDN